MFSGTVGSLTQQSGVLSGRVPSRGQRRTAHAAARPGAKVASKASTFPPEDAIGLSTGLDTTPHWTACDLPLPIIKKKKLANQKLAKELDTDTAEDPLEVLLAPWLPTMMGRADKRLTSKQAEGLEQQLRRGNRSDQLRAAQMVYLLGWNKENQDTLGRAEIIPPLVNMLKSRNSGAQKAAAAAISNLLASDSNRKELIAAPASYFYLMRLLESASVHVGIKIFAAQTLGGFKKSMPYDFYWNLNRGAIMFSLSGLLWHKPQPVMLQAEAARALCNFYCADMRGLGERGLVDLLQPSTSMSDIVQDAAFEAVTPFAVRYLTTRFLVDECRHSPGDKWCNIDRYQDWHDWHSNILPSLLRLLQCKQTRLQYAAAMAVCVVAKRGLAMAEALEEAGAIPRVVELLYSPTLAVHSAASRAVKLLRSYDSLRGQVTAAVQGSLREHGPREDVIRLLQEP